MAFCHQLMNYELHSLLSRPFNMSINSRLLMIFLALIALPSLMIGVLAIKNARENIESRVKARLSSVADLKAGQISDWLVDRKSDALLIANNFLNEEHFTIILDPNSDPEKQIAFAGFLTDNIVSIQQARLGYKEIMFVDINGRIILSTDPDRIGKNLSTDLSVIKTLSSPSGEHTEDIHLSTDGTLEMTFGHVLHKVDLLTNKTLKEINGAVIIRVQMDDTIYPLIDNWPDRGATGETLLVRPEGDEIVYLNPLQGNDFQPLSFSINRSASNAQPAHLSVSGNNGIITASDYAGDEVLAAYRSIPEMGWGLVVKQDVSEAFAPVSDLTKQWLLITFIILFIGVLVSVILARTLIRPLERLVSVTRLVANGDYSTQVSIDRNDELGDLAKSFQAMVHAVRERDSNLKSHSEELSALFDLSKMLMSTLRKSEIVDYALNFSINATSCSAGAVLLTNKSTEALLVEVVRNLPASLLGQQLPIDIHTEPGYSLVHREPFYISDIRDDNKFNALSIFRASDVRAILSVPLLIGDQPLGAIVLQSFEPREFTENEIHVVTAIANQAALALERAQLFDDLNESYDRTLQALVAALDFRDKETEGHSQRVVAYTLALADQMDFPADDLSTLRRGALLHDIGKIGVPDSILRKPGPLTSEEWEIMHKHPSWGFDILSGIPFLESAAEIVKSHQERWDGNGYDRGLAGENIPLGARIFSVADAFDAITSDRPYRSGRSYAVALDEIVNGSGSQFDPHVVDAFKRMPESIWADLKNKVMSSRTELVLPPTPKGDQLLKNLPNELKAFSRLIMTLGNSPKPDEFLNDAVRTSVDVLGAEACGIFLYDQENDSLSLAADHGLPEALKKHFMRFPVNGFHNEQVIRDGCIRLHEDWRKIPAFIDISQANDRPEWQNYLCVPLIAAGETTGVMGLFSKPSSPFDESRMHLFGLMGEQIGLALVNARRMNSIRQLAITDGLTGAYNRRYLNEFIEQELKRHTRYNHEISLILLDIDNYKQYNDKFGHLAGDQALHEFVSLLRRNIRTFDFVARYGGDEFVIVLPETIEAGANNVAKKIRNAVNAYKFPHASLTVSQGLVHLQQTSNIQLSEFLNMADQALFRAKQQGRDAIVIWKNN